MKKLLIFAFLIGLIVPSFANTVEYINKWDQMVTPSSTTAINVGGCIHHKFSYTVAAISTNVVVKAEGSDDNSLWFNIDDNDATVTKSANGTFDMHKANYPVKYIRFTFVSESGGTNATLDVDYMGYAPSN